MKLGQKTSWIQLANDQVRISDVLASVDIFVQSAELSSRSRKIHCPFGKFYHSDSGLEKTMRVFHESNSAYCFRCNQSYDPVSLASAIWDVSRNAAALRLLDDAGFKPKSLEERWNDAVGSLKVEVDLLSLADALKVYCSGIASDWTIRQLDDTVAVKLNACLELLSSVHTEQDAEKWLSICKQVMRNQLEN